MKRLFVVLIVSLIAAAGAFGLSLSAGGGASISSTSWNLSITAGGTTVSAKDAILPFGAKAFVDAKYVQVSVGYIMAVKATQSGTGITTTTYSNNLSYLTFAALGKYPFDVGSFTLFPLLGAEYDFNIAHGSSDYFEGSNGLLASPSSADYNQFWLKGGVGADISLGGKLYVRPEALYGFKLLNSDESNLVSALKSAGATSASLDFGTFDFALLIGYKL